MIWLSQCALVQYVSLWYTVVKIVVCIFTAVPNLRVTNRNFTGYTRPSNNVLPYKLEEEKALDWARRHVDEEVPPPPKNPPSGQGGGHGVGMATVMVNGVSCISTVNEWVTTPCSHFGSQGVSGDAFVAEVGPRRVKKAILSI